MFKVGQKVVLVDDKWPETVKQIYLQLPVLDTVYVVRAVRVGVRADELIMDMRRVLDRMRSRATTSRSPVRGSCGR